VASVSDPDEGDDVPPPRVPSEDVDGWDRVETSVERLFGVDGADVRGHTVVYEDRQLRRAAREAAGGCADRTWRFVFATRLDFRPPLPPGAEPVILPAVRQRATRAFRDDLRDRGVAAVEVGRRERLRTDSGERRRIRQVTGSVRTSAGTVPVEGWVGVSDGDGLHVAGGAYPGRSLADALDVAVGAGADTGSDGEQGDRALLRRDPGAHREHLLGFVIAVG
jgi:hypothetical protein